MIFDATSLNTPEIYRLLVGGVTPRPIAWISTISDKGVHNIAPYSFFNVASVNPPVLSYSQVTPQTGSDKDTLRNLKQTKECVVHIVSADSLARMNQSCAALGEDQSEFEFAGIEAVNSHSVAPLSATESLVRYECTLRDVISFGENPGSGSLVLLDVKFVYVQDELLKNGQIDQRMLASIGKMGGDFYSFTKDIIELSRP